MAKIEFIGHFPLPHEQVLLHVEHAKGLGYPHVLETEPHGRRLSVVGGGPSVIDHLDEIRAFTDIWSINGACGFLREHCIESTLVTLDPCDFLAPRVKGAKKAMLATRCHPEVFRILEGAEIEVFDAAGDTTAGIWASCSTVTAMFHLSCIKGYRQTVFYGCEGSFPNETHAYMNDPDCFDYRFVVRVGEDSFITAPDLYMVTRQMAMLLRRSINDAFTERSGGLLRALIENPEHDITHVSRKLMESLTPMKEAA